MKTYTKDEIIKRGKDDGYEIQWEKARDIAKYLEILSKWSDRTNIIGPSAKTSIWEDHISESIWLEGILKKGGITADIGSGGGFPGVIIGCMRKDEEIKLIESKEKKANFLKYVIDNIPLNKAKIINKRIDRKKAWKEDRFDLIVSRAAGRIENLLEIAEIVAADRCTLYAMVGKDDLGRIEKTGNMIGKGWKREKIISKEIYGKIKGIIVYQKDGENE